MKMKPRIRTATALGVACSALLGYVASQWPAQEYESLIPSGKIIQHVKASGEGWVFKAVQFSNCLYVIELKMGNAKVNQEWTPKIGDRVQTNYRPDNFGGPPFITTITNIVKVGSRSQTGLLVYGDGLPAGGLDSWWVKPTP